MSLRYKATRLFRKRILNPLIGLIDKLIPKKESIVVFSGNNLRGINGNVAAVINAWQNNPKTIYFKAYVLSIENEHFDSIETINPNSIIGVYILLRAYTVIISHGPADFYWKSLAKNRRRRIINLWHGVPLKEIKPFTSWNHTILISSSMIERLALSASSMVPLDKIFVTGFPRTDQIIKYHKELRQDVLKKLKQTDDGKRWILYAPTYREGNNCKSYLHELSDFSLGDLINILIENNAYLIFRYHINKPILNFPENERILFANFNLFQNIEPLYALSDILITDYSSNIFEYLLLNRPIIGLAADIEEYSKATGLLFDYKSIFPGAIAINWSKLRELIVEALKNPSADADIREDRLKLFNQYMDGNSAERCINLICDMNTK